LKFEISNHQKSQGAKVNKAFVLLLAAGWMAASCAYRFAGADTPPFGIRRISVAMFDNSTTETGLEALFANHLTNELARDFRWTIGSPEKSDAAFQGIVKSLFIESVSYEKAHVSLERRVVMRADVWLKSRDGKLLWEGKNLWASDVYPVSPDKRQTEQHLQNALSRISRKMAQNIVMQINWGAVSSSGPDKNIFRNRPR
jgi:hypothetical protein